MILPIQSNLRMMSREITGAYADCAIAVIYKSRPRDDWLGFAQDIKVRFTKSAVSSVERRKF